MNLIEQYEKAKKALYDHVGFFEGWVVYAIEDRTDMVWCVDGYEVKFAEHIQKLCSVGDYYTNEIYTQQFHGKHVYRGDEYTMIIVDTYIDGNKFFAFFSNDKEIKS